VNETVANMLAWDLGFLAFGAALVIGGVALSRRDRAPAEAAREVRRIA
jgi:uncharacterized membrane protein